MSPPGRPSPADMPQRRRPVIPTRPPAPARSAFYRAAGIPQRGWDDATVWPDAGILLFLGTADDLPRRFTRHFRGRVQVPRRAENEVRGHSNGGGTTAQELRKTNAATAVIRALFLGGGTFPKPELNNADLPLVDQIITALKNLPGGKGKAHGGEAELIALAVREQRNTSERQVLLANDGGASIVAALHHVPTRHAADVLAEFACADPELSAARCLELFTESCFVSAPPTSCWPEDDTAFRCRRSESTCAPCDAVDRST
jgi:hypothetical protein